MRRFEEAITACQDAAAISRESRNRHREGMALNNLGLALRLLRRPDKSISAHEGCDSHLLGDGDGHHQGIALNNLGLALRQARRFGEAISAHEGAIAIMLDLRVMPTSRRGLLVAA